MFDQFPVYREIFPIRYYETDCQNRVSALSLFNYLQEAAGENARQLGISVTDLHQEGLAWVLMRLYVEMQEWPQGRDLIEVITYPRGFDKFFVYRDFIIQNQAGRRLGQASSIWLVMDAQSRKMARVPDYILNIPLPQHLDFLPLRQDKMPLAPSYAHGQDYTIHWHDLDLNHHANNARFVQWALDGLPPDWIQTHQLKSLDILFRKEGRLYESIQAQAQALDAQTMSHRIIRQTDKQDLAQLVSTWQTIHPPEA
ncbi:MAG: thioesterase [Microscillaceae bacterium]